MITSAAVPDPSRTAADGPDPDDTAQPLVVIGIGADGWEGLGGEARRILTAARVVIGGARHLALLPEVPGQERRPWPSPLRQELPAVLARYAGTRVAVLASGDPLVSGVGSTLIELLGPGRVVIVPALSSVALARSWLRWPAESHAVVRVAGPDVSPVRRELAPGRRILVLSADEHTPRQVAELLVEAGYGESALTVLGDLGGERSSSQRVDRAVRLTVTAFTFPRLNIVAIECTGPHLGGWVAGLPDDAFEHDGQLTKRDLRAAALARLAPAPGEHLWDVGAGAGSVGIEWMRAHRSCTASAVESVPERAARIIRNARRLGVPGLAVVTGRAPAALAGLPAPHAVFVGGGATVPGVIDACLAALPPGGRLVIHAVTLQTEQLLAERYLGLGGELTRIAVETAAPIGSFTGWTPARAVTQWAYTRS
jgi:precorrin-6Y C5,15-methyltransferase (decarboxylating)